MRCFRKLSKIRMRAGEIVKKEAIAREVKIAKRANTLIKRNDSIKHSGNLKNHPKL